MRRRPLLFAWVAQGVAAVLLLIAPALAPLAAIAHVAAAGLAARAATDPDARLYAFGLVLALPGLGLAGLAALGLARRPREIMTVAPPHSRGFSLPAPGTAPDVVEPVFDWIQRQLTIRPLADVMRAGDRASRLWAIRLLASRHEASAVELLRDGLQSGDRDVQIAAANALRRIEEGLSAGIARAHDAALGEPESPARWQALAEACCTYVRSTLPPVAMRRPFRAQAEDAYRRALALDGESSACTLGLAQVLVDAGQLEEAEALVRGVVAGDAETRPDRFLAEILFHRGRWADLREVCRAAVASGEEDALLAWWAAPPRPADARAEAA